jgi:hypothetical protein
MSRLSSFITHDKERTQRSGWHYDIGFIELFNVGRQFNIINLYKPYIEHRDEMKDTNIYILDK